MECLYYVHVVYTMTQSWFVSNQEYKCALQNDLIYSYNGFCLSIKK